jgi:hypothetical protein
MQNTNFFPFSKVSSFLTASSVLTAAILAFDDFYSKMVTGRHVIIEADL